MTVSTLGNRQSYMGNGVANVFAYPHKFLLEEDLTVIEVDDEGLETPLVLDTDFLVTGMGEPDGGEVTLATITAPVDPLDPPVVTPRSLPTGHRLVIVGTPSFIQPFAPLKDRAIPPESAERAWDRIVLYVQRLADLASRSFRLKDSEASGINTEIPEIVGNRVLATNEDGTAVQLRSIADLVAAEGAGLPPGGDEYDALERSASEGIGRWVSLSYIGFSQRYNQLVNLVGLKAILDFIFNMGYSAPSVAFTASGSNTLRERGNNVTAVTLDLAFTKVSEDVEEVRFYYDGGLVHTDNTLNPTSDNVSFNWTGSFNSNKTFQAQVDDATNAPAVTVNRPFSFVFAYLYGCGAAGLSDAAIAGLTKLIENSAPTKNLTFTPTAGQVFYFAQPSSYPALTDIVDLGTNLSIFSSFSVRTANLTNTYSVVENYRIYEFTLPQSPATYNLSFRR